VRALSRAVLAVLFVGAGVLHFVRPRPFVAIVPPGLPEPEALVAVSGAAEIAGGLGLLVPGLRRWAGWGLVALLVAVFPANVHMAIAREQVAPALPAWALWARLPLQGVLVAWVLSAIREPRAVRRGGR